MGCFKIIEKKDDTKLLPLEGYGHSGQTFVMDIYKDPWTLDTVGCWHDGRREGMLHKGWCRWNALWDGCVLHLPRPLCAFQCRLVEAFQSTGRRECLMQFGLRVCYSTWIVQLPPGNDTLPDHICCDEIFTSAKDIVWKCCKQISQNLRRFYTPPCLFSGSIFAPRVGYMLICEAEPVKMDELKTACVDDQLETSVVTYQPLVEQDYGLVPHSVFP